MCDLCSSEAREGQLIWWKHAVLSKPMLLCWQLLAKPPFTSGSPSLISWELCYQKVDLTSVNGQVTIPLLSATYHLKQGLRTVNFGFLKTGLIPKSIYWDCYGAANLTFSRINTNPWKSILQQCSSVWPIRLPPTFHNPCWNPCPAAMEKGTSKGWPLSSPRHPYSLEYLGGRTPLSSTNHHPSLLSFQTDGHFHRSLWHPYLFMMLRSTPIVP